jgi:hypothetical protein
LFVVNPVTVIGDTMSLVVPGAPPSDDVHDAVYPVIGEPPLNGAVNVTITDVPRPTTVGGAGASGTVFGIAAADAIDAGPLPSTLDASTVHVYVRPLVRPDTTIGDDTPIAVPVAPPFEEVQVALYDVIGEPPSNGGVNVTRKDPFRATRIGGAGASGTVFGTAAADATDGGPLPSTLDANTVHV